MEEMERQVNEKLARWGLPCMEDMFTIMDMLSVQYSEIVNESIVLIADAVLKGDGEQTVCQILSLFAMGYAVGQKGAPDGLDLWRED